MPCSCISLGKGKGCINWLLRFVLVLKKGTDNMVDLMTSGIRGVLAASINWLPCRLDYLLCVAKIRSNELISRILLRILVDLILWRIFADLILFKMRYDGLGPGYLLMRFKVGDVAVG